MMFFRFRVGKKRSNSFIYFEQSRLMCHKSRDADNNDSAHSCSHSFMATRRTVILLARHTRNTIHKHLIFFFCFWF